MPSQARESAGAGEVFDRAPRWMIARAIGAVVVPVSIAMALCVWLVTLLRDDASQEVASGSVVSAVYTETESDSAFDKLKGSVMNAAVFVGFITAMTFALFLLFKYRLGKVIWAYMGLSGFLIFGILGGNICMRVLQKLNVAVDMVTVSVVLWNFTVGGVLLTFFWNGPLLAKQGYLISVSVIVSFYFSNIPEWTTWSMLVAMALYDLYAVLTPNGPLRLMVELAQERDEDIPALVYESRGTGANGGRRGYARVKTDDDDPSGAPVSSSSSYDPSMADEGARYTLPDSIKLGLGDFIFYSVLVGRAAMWSPITCTFCFIAVISGLVITLLALGLYGKALPALPVSIALGVSTYFLSRFLLEPAIVRWYAREFVCA